jgi:hypothetical protein
LRLLLDAHLSGRRIGNALRERGHDVRAVDEERDLEGAEDAELLSLATRENRILITSNAKDFDQILKEWAGGGRRHAGCILLSRRLRHEQFGRIIVGVERALANVPEQDAWLDRAIWVSL